MGARPDLQFARSDRLNAVPVAGRDTADVPTHAAFVESTLPSDAWSISTSDVWCQAIPTNRTSQARPTQGWKIHISAAVPDASETLEAVLPVLRRHNVMFKVARDRSTLAQLNDGQAGISQTGKFVTAYPVDDVAAVELARDLHIATIGRRGPWIPSDRPLTSTSIVHYRYGSFVAPAVVDADGASTSLLASPDGRVHDMRGDTYLPPTWVRDPFLAAGVAEDLPVPDPVIAGRYVIVDTLHRSSRGAVQLAVDVETRSSVVLKRAHRWAAVAQDGRDAVDRLRAERACLVRLGPRPGFPSAGELLTDRDDLLLVLEDIDGGGLEVEIEQRRLSAEPYTSTDALAIVAQVADLLAAVHDEGWVHRDVKPGNVRFRPDRTPVLIDFELTGPPGPIDADRGRGTRGYVAPERRDGGMARPSDDVYALGVMLHELLTLEYPWDAPDTWRLADHDPRALHPALPAAVVEVRDLLLAPEAARPADARIAGERLRQAITGATSPDIVDVSTAPPMIDRTIAAESLDALLQWFERTARRDGEGCWWASGNGTVLPRSLYGGDAGIVLALTTAVRAGRAVDEDMLRGAAVRLAGRSGHDAPFTEGSLYTGAAGVAVALDHAGEILDLDDLRAAARREAASAASCPLANPDVLAGAAGRAVAHLLLHERTGSDEDLTAAAAAVRHLAATADRSGGDATHGDRIGWVLPDVGAGLSHRCFRGYAHGTAGIADALLAVGRQIGDPDVIAAARDAIDVLVDTAAPACAGGQGANWYEPDRPTTGQGLKWCYGAPGVALVLHRAVYAGLDVDATLDSAVRATEAAWFLGPCRCHGLAGSIGTLLDTADICGSEAAARHHGSLLTRWLCDVGDGLEPRLGNATSGPGLMTGAGGMVIALARLVDPSVPDPLRPSVQR